MEEDQLRGQSVSQLRSILSSRGLDFSDCIEKGDLINKILHHNTEKNTIGPPHTFKCKIGSLQCTVVQNSNQPELIVVLNHGYGASGDDLVPLAHTIFKENNQKHIKIVFTEAPIVMEHGGRAWWNINLQDLMVRAMQGQLLQIISETPNGLEDARTELMSTLNQLKSQHNLPWSRFVLGGFSQGAILSTDVCLHITEEPIAALVLFSGSVVSIDKWRELIKQRKPGTKVLQSHGKQDMVLPFVLGIHLKQILQTHFDLDFVEFEGPHSIPNRGIKKLVALIYSL